MSDPFSEEAWDERYRSRDALWSGNPNPKLVSEVADMSPGLALDAGAGEGADAIWLASRGWHVLAVDISAVALQRAAEHAGDRGNDLAGRIEWRHADLTSWTPGDQTFDLVSVQFMQLPAPLRNAMFRRLAAAVAPGGTLLIVGHHPSDLQTSVPRPPLPELFYTGDDVAALLDDSQWTDVVHATSPRPAVDPDGNEVTVHDTVVRATRRRPRS